MKILLLLLIFLLTTTSSILAQHVIFDRFSGSYSERARMNGTSLKKCITVGETLIKKMQKMSTTFIVSEELKDVAEEMSEV